MFEPKSLVPKTERPLLAPRQSPGSHEPKQRGMMVAALVLLLMALGIVLWRDRDFWFPETQEADDQPTQSAPAVNIPVQQTPAVAKAVPSAVKARPRHSARLKPQPNDAAAVAPAPPVTTTTSRTVLPPLEVEVVAGDTHRTVRPGSNSVQVDLQPGSPPQAVSDSGTLSGTADTAANLTSNAAERVQMSAYTAENVSLAVSPGYPLLARQMKVQGSVILQALISRDGTIQDLHVVSGPPILAIAAQDAVKQWHFKPHYLGAEAVETQAKITVNFTISTN